MTQYRFFSTFTDSPELLELLNFDWEICCGFLADEVQYRHNEEAESEPQDDTLIPPPIFKEMSV